MVHTRLAERWENGAPVFGGWVTSGSAAALESFARAGCDYVAIDCQHGYADESEAAQLLRGLQHLPIAVLVRVSTLAPALIGKVVDAGADGVIVPMISSAAEARSVVAATRYAPRGVRSFGPLRASLGMDPGALEDRVATFAMIETAEAAGELAAICATEGLTGVYVGPADLALGVGERPAATPGPAVEAVLEAVITETRAAGIVAGIHAGSGAAASRYAGRGFRLLTVGAESQLLTAAAASELAAARAKP